MLTDFGRNSFVTWTTGLKERIQKAEKENQMRNYRGLTKDGKWVYGFFIINTIGDYNVYKNGYFIDVIPESVGQQVGLKDKNGTEIYEDSIGIVYFGDLPSTLTAIAQIVYLENECRFVAKGIGKDKGKGPWTIDSKRFEVTGTIHQEQDNDPTNPR